MILAVLVTIVALVLLVGLLLLIRSVRQQRRLGLLTGERLSQDTQETPGELLRATSVPLRGKPAYLIRRGSSIIPVEIKTTGHIPAATYRHYLVQLYCYCLLVEEHYGVRPPFGVVRYLDRSSLALLKEEQLAYPDGTAEHIRALVREVIAKCQ